MTCSACGAELEIGSFPFCPHGQTVAGKLADVTWAGGRTFENLAHEPQTFYSKAEYQKFLKQTKQQEMVRWAGPHDKHVSRWVTMDPYTLESAKALLERVGRTQSGNDRTQNGNILESFTSRELTAEEMSVT